MQSILIYRCKNANLTCLKQIIAALKHEECVKGYPIKLIDSSEVKKGTWKKHAKLIIIPGGRDVPYHLALQGEANHHIRSFVKEGGNFLGLCAGGYYGSSLVEFEKGNPLEVVGERELRFFPGVAQGPAMGWGEFCYFSEHGAKIARLVGRDGKSFAAYYHGGSLFLNAHTYSNVDVMASYEEIEGHPAAIVCCQSGKGIAILSGVHPEFSAFFLKRKIPLWNALKEVEESRRALFQKILSYFDFK